MIESFELISATGRSRGALVEFADRRTVQWINTGSSGRERRIACSRRLLDVEHLPLEQGTLVFRYQSVVDKRPLTHRVLVRCVRLPVLEL